MKKTNKFLFLGIFLLLTLLSCHKKEEKVEILKTKTKDEQIFEDDSLDKLLDLDNLSEDENKELLEISEKTEKLNVYFENWIEIIKNVYLLDIYDDYKDTFLDTNNNFIKADDSKINKFLLNTSKLDFKNLDDAIQKFKIEIKKEPKYEKADKLIEDWMKSLKNLEVKVKEIQNYYHSGEYKKDDFSKGKKLNSEYLESVKQQEERCKNISKFNFKSRYLPQKEVIIEVKKEYGKDFVVINFLKLNMLIEIFYLELHNWDLINSFDTFTIPVEKKNKEQYLEKLKKIQIEIRKIFKETKEKNYNFNTLKMSVDKETYFLVIDEFQKSLELTNKIISDIENNNYEKINENSYTLNQKNLEIGTILAIKVKL